MCILIKYYGGENMRVSKKKIELEMSRRCMSVGDIVAKGISKGTFDRVRYAESAKPETVGRIAKAIGCDVTEILADE